MAERARGLPIFLFCYRTEGESVKMVFAKELIRQEAYEPANDSTQRRDSLFRTASLRSQTVSASSSSSSSSSPKVSSPKVSSPTSLSSTSRRPPLSTHQNSRLRRQTSLQAFDYGEGAGKSVLPSVLPVKSSRSSLVQRAEALVDEFGVVAAAAAFPRPREKAATASNTLPLFSRRHSVSRPPSCTISTASSSRTKTTTKHNCSPDIKKTHHSRLSATSFATVTAPSSSEVPPRIRTCFSTPTKVTAPRRDLRQQRGEIAGSGGGKATASPSSATSQIPKIKTHIMESREAKGSQSSFHLPVVRHAEGSTTSRSPHTPTPTPTTLGRVKATTNAVPWAKWAGQQGHVEDGGSVHEQHETESSTGLDLLDITVGSQLLLEGDEMEEMLKAEIGILGIMEQSSSTILKSSPPRITLLPGGEVENETVSSTIPTMNFTASQQEMVTITLERDEAVRQWQNSQEEMCQIQTRLAQLEAAATDQQDIKSAEKAASTHHRHTAPTRNATSQTEARDDVEVVDSADDTLNGTLRLCRVEYVRDGWRQAAQMANHQMEVLHMQASVTGYLMDQLNQLERSLLSSSSSQLLHSNDEASPACSSSS